MIAGAHEQTVFRHAILLPPVDLSDHPFLGSGRRGS
jgi:hypothetical protein